MWCGVKAGSASQRGKAWAWAAADEGGSSPCECAAVWHVCGSPGGTIGVGTGSGGGGMMGAWVEVEEETSERKSGYDTK